jgi:hypothetical protein
VSLDFKISYLSFATFAAIASFSATSPSMFASFSWSALHAFSAVSLSVAFSCITMDSCRSALENFEIKVYSSVACWSFELINSCSMLCLIFDDNDS